MITFTPYLSGINLPLMIMILTLGILSSWQDIKYGKVRNRLLKSFFLLGIFLILIAFIYSLLQNKSLLKVNDLGRIVGATFLAIFIGFFGWKFKMWTAADAKLFIVCVFLLPPAYYDSQSFFSAFLGLGNLLINILLVFFVYVVIESFIGVIGLGLDILSGRHKLPRSKTPKRINLKRTLEVFKIVIGYICVISLIQLLRYYLGSSSLIKSVQVVLYIGLILSYPIFFRVFRKFNLLLIVPVIAVLVFLVISKSFWGFYFVRGVIKALCFISTLSLIRILADYYHQKKEIIVIPVEKLKPKLVLAGTTLSKLKNILYPQRVYLYPEGLTEEQAEEFKNILRRNNINTVECYRGFSFAPFVFSGVIITLLLRENIWSFLF